MATVDALLDFGEDADDAGECYDELPPGSEHTHCKLLVDIDEGRRSFEDDPDDVEDDYEEDGSQEYLREGSPVASDRDENSLKLIENLDDFAVGSPSQNFEEADKSSESAEDESDPDPDNLDEFDPLCNTMSESTSTVKTTTTKTRRAKKVVTKKKAVSVSSRGSSTSDVSDGAAERKNYEAQFGDLLTDTPEGVAVNGTELITTEQNSNAQEDATYIQSADAVVEDFYTREDVIAYADDSNENSEAVDHDSSDSEFIGVEAEPTGEPLVTSPSVRRQMEIASKTANRPVSLVVASADSRCRICDKRVYEMEKVIADEILYHKTCFKCSHCKRVLSLGNFASISGQLLCKPHFLELFKTKGNYEEGFGLQRHTKQWSTPETLSSKVYKEDEVDNSPKEEEDGTTDMNIQRSVETAKEVEDTKANIRSLRSKFLEQDVHSPAIRTSQSTNSSQPETLEFRSNGIVAHVTVERNETKTDEEKRMEEEHQASTRCLVARFNSPNSETPSPRKAIHKITPPRQELAQGIQTALAAQNSQSSQVMEEVTTPEPEQNEFPEHGTTALLLARWKNMEQEGSVPLVPTTPMSAYRGTPRKERLADVTATVTTPSDTVDAVSADSHVEDVIRGEEEEEEFVEEGEDLIAACHTQNMLAKFKVMEEQAERDSVIYKPSPNRDFRWRVNEVKPLSRPNLSSRSDSVTYEDASKLEPVSYENQLDSGDDEVYTNGNVEEEEEEEDKHLVSDELPSPTHTRNILAKFRSMEDDTMLPPSPQRAIERQATPHVAPSHLVENGHSLHHESENEEEDETIELPEEGTTRQLLAKFQAMQSQC